MSETSTERVARWRLTPSEFAATAESLAKINARAAKRGFTGRFALEGETVQVKEKGLTTVYVDAILTGQAPSYAGWEFLAAVDTVGEGFVLRVAPGVGESGVDRSALVAGQCEHCQMSRRRKYTYLVREQATGRTLQVGSTCIKDFLGWEGKPVFFSLAEVAEDLGWGGGGSHWEPEFTPASVVAVALAVVERYGYTPASSWDGQPTKEAVRDYLVGRDRAANELREQVGQPLEAKGQEVVAALLERGLTGDSDYVQNLRVALAAEVVGQRQWGLVTSAVVAYQRMVEREVKARAAAKVPSVHLGAQGEKITVTGVVTTASRIEGYYGASVLLVLQTGAGEVVKAFSSAAWVWDVEQGQQVTMTGTVKDHETYKGVAQTVLTRVKGSVVAPFQAVA